MEQLIKCIGCKKKFKKQHMQKLHNLALRKYVYYCAKCGKSHILLGETTQLRKSI